MNHFSNKWALLVIICLGLAFNLKYLNEFPNYIHAWAQSDRYALSVGFTDNGLNFFEPESLIYTHQFPGDWTRPTNSTVTAVGFPVHEYIPAVIMKVTGEIAPWIFRTYILLYSFLGLFFLYKLACLITGDFYRSLFLVIFGATSPVFMYYQGGFLPTIPSWSNAIIGIYFYQKYRRERQQQNFTLSILFLTLASLSRLPFAIALIAVLILEFLNFLKNKPYKKSKLVVTGIAITLLVANFLYTVYLRDRYGSDFLNQPLPARSMSEALNLVKSTLYNWGTQYFSSYHYMYSNGPDCCQKSDGPAENRALGPVIQDDLQF